MKEFKEEFLERYFPYEKMDVMTEEFIHLRQGCMSVKEYSLKYILLSKYAPSLMSNPRDDMSRLLTSVSDIVKEDCRTTMLHGDMALCSLTV